MTGAITLDEKQGATDYAVFKEHINKCEGRWFKVKRLRRYAT